MQNARMATSKIALVQPGDQFSERTQQREGMVLSSGNATRSLVGPLQYYESKQ